MISHMCPVHVPTQAQNGSTCHDHQGAKHQHLQQLHDSCRLRPCTLFAQLRCQPGATQGHRVCLTLRYRSYNLLQLNYSGTACKSMAGQGQITGEGSEKCVRVRA